MHKHDIRLQLKDICSKCIKTSCTDLANELALQNTIWLGYVWNTERYGLLVWTFKMYMVYFHHM